MEFSKLGDSDLVVSRCCLGTMTWGQQNTVCNPSPPLPSQHCHGACASSLKPAKATTLPYRAKSVNPQEDEGVEQLDIAFNEYGVNFLDTAEM